MKHGSLFSGIGGFDLAAEWMGWENIFHCEIAEFPRKILKYHFPNSICYEDIKKTDFTKHRGEIDIISGGFPCQPYSNAGKRKGKDDDRHLWPEMLRVIREIQPRFVVGENVAGLLSWNNGMVFHEIITDLENEGYETQAFLIPACATNAPHRRDRVWFVAHTDNGSGLRNTVQTRGTEPEELHEPSSNATNTDSKRHTSYGKSKSIKGNWSGNNGEQKERSEQAERINGLDGFLRIITDTDGTKQRNDIGENIGQEREIWRGKEGDVFGKLRSDGNVADTDDQGLQRGKVNGSIKPIRQDGKEQLARCFSSNWQNFPTQSPICGGDDGIPTELDGITFPKWRNESIKGYGNAVVPQVVYQIFKAIEQSLVSL